MSDRQLLSERFAFDDLRHVLCFWAHFLYHTALHALLDASGTERTKAAQKCTAEQVDMVLMLAEVAELPAVGQALVHRSLSAAERAAAYWLVHQEAEFDEDRFYPWRFPSYWGVETWSAARAADLAALASLVAH